MLQLKLLPEEVEHPLIFAMPDKSRLSLVDFSFYLPMELLSIPNCLQVILAILLEQKVSFYTFLYRIIKYDRNIHRPLNHGLFNANINITRFFVHVLFCHSSAITPQSLFF